MKRLMIPALLLVGLVALFLVVPLVPAQDGGGAAAAPEEVSFDCGDSPDLSWRCTVVHADEVAPGLELMHGAGMPIDSLSVTAWHFDPKGQVTHVVISGYLPSGPPTFD